MIRWILRIFGASNAPQSNGPQAIGGPRAQSPRQQFDQESRGPIRFQLFIEVVQGGHILTFKTLAPETNSTTGRSAYKASPYGDDDYEVTKYLVPDSSDLGEQILAGLAIEKMRFTE